jgi:cold shock CspA family protein
VRCQGKITDWRDDRGFGFVTPKDGGQQVFVHIKSFSNPQRRPVGNELVSYELTSDARGRLQCVNIAFVGDWRSSFPPTTAPGPGVVAMSFAFAFLAFAVGAVIAGKLPFWCPSHT